MTFTLPNTRFTVNLPIQKINYNASTNLQLKPKHEVRQSFDDFLKNEDTVLNFTYDLLKNDRK